MAVRWRNKGFGEIVCAAENPEEENDIYFDDEQHYYLTQHKILKTDNNGETWYWNLGEERK